jgi:hypothetical protein
MKSKILRRNVSNTIKIQKFKKYGLDYIKDAYESCVLFFSYFQISGKYRGKCCRIIRGSDYTTKDIYFVAGYIDYKAVESFCSGTTGKVTIKYNQSKVSGAQNAIQTTYNNMPIIYESGAFVVDGFKFVAADSEYISVVDYAGIQIINPILSIYSNYYNITNHNGYIIAKNIDSSANMQYSLQNYFDKCRFIEEGNVITSVDHLSTGNNKTIITWDSKSINGFYQRSNANISQTTLNKTFTNRNIITLGARGNYDNYYDGNIKTIAIFNSNQYINYSQLAALI